jgi:hypothetical protein
MNPLTIIAILELVNKAVSVGGEIVPIALRAYNALRSEPGMTDEELIAASEALNEADAQKLDDLIAALTP